MSMDKSEMMEQHARRESEIDEKIGFGKSRRSMNGGAGSPSTPPTPQMIKAAQNAEAEKARAAMTPIQKAKAATLAFINGKYFTTAMTTFTIYALFGDDMRALAFPMAADSTFLVLSSIAFVLFWIELFLSCWTKEGYWITPNFRDPELYKWPYLGLIQFGSFFFWLDLVATLSLIFELTYIYPAAAESEVREDSTTLGAGGPSGDDLSAARAGRASRAGARAGRIVRMVRLVRLVKLYKFASEKGGGAEVAKDDDEEETAEESRVGAAMSALTTRRVITGVLAMLVALPLLSYNPDDEKLPFAINYVNKMNVGCDGNVDCVRTAAEQADGYTRARDFLVKSEMDCPPGKSVCHKLYSLDVTRGSHADAADLWEADTMPNLRNAEILIVRSSITISEGDTKTLYRVEAKFDVRDKTHETALYGFLLTIFVIILLGGGTMVFSQDVNRLVIIPIERMVSLVRDISENPLGYTVKEHKDGMGEGMETTLLIQTITKLGGLMRVGFGQAGADVIAKNLNESEGGGGKLNLLGGGSMIKSIFGFCDIRQFTDTTECLQEEVMLFVNRIANILHSIVTQCGGAANKNIGDAFLLTWKLLPEYSDNEISTLADRSLFSFLKFTAEMCRHNDAICKFTVAATARLYQRMPEYRVRMGLGLHVGWAVEGAIGSEKKIDASYISPHVNMAEYLESSTKKYGVPLLMSEPFYDLLSTVIKGYCRQVDSIRTEKSRRRSEPPMGLFTYDCDMTATFEKVRPDSSLLVAAIAKSVRKKKHEDKKRDYKSVHKSRKQAKMDRKRAVKQRRDSQPDFKTEEDLAPPNLGPYSPSVWSEDIDLVMLRRRTTGPFMKMWREGMQAFVDGEWPHSLQMFTNTLSLSGGSDGPSKHLIEYIESQGGGRPKGWLGWREL